MKTKKERLFRWALWWGLGIVVVCLAALLTDSFMNMGESTSSDELASPMFETIYRLIYRFGIWPIIIYIGIIGPIVEEFCFRLWGDSKRWTGYTSVVLMSLWGLAIGWWAGLLTLAAGITIMVVLRNDRTKRLFALMMLSSAIFALAHIGNYTPDQGLFMFIVALAHKLGMGLVASYLVINHNILWSMGFHILNNIIVAIPLGLMFHMVTDQTDTIESDNYRLEMRCVLVEDDNIDSNNNFFSNTDTNHHFASMSHFADQTLRYSSWGKGDNPMTGNVKITAVNDWPKCTFDLVFKRKPFAYDALIEDLVASKWIRIDTVVEDAYRMYIADTALLAANDTTGFTYFDLQLFLHSEHSVMSEYDYNEGITFHITGIDHSNKNSLSLEEIRAILERQGIVIEPTEERMTHYTIHGTYNPLSEL